MTTLLFIAIELIILSMKHESLISDPRYDWLVAAAYNRQVMKAVQWTVTTMQANITYYIPLYTRPT